MRDSSVPKQYIKVCGIPILVYTLRTFQANVDVDRIVIVAEKQWQSQIQEWIEEEGLVKFTGFAEPGKTRQESIFHGLAACAAMSATTDDVVIVHDAARPMVTGGLISECIHVAAEYGGCMPVLPITDTTYYSEDGRTIERLLDRNMLFAGQAPEAFNLVRYHAINSSVSEEELNSYKGSSEIAYKYGIEVKLIPGDDKNFKITTPSDLERFRIICIGQ